MNVQYRSVVHFCWLLKKGPKEIHQLMVDAYGPQCPTLSFVKKWAVEFKNGRESLDDLHRPGRPPSEDYIQKVSSYIEEFPFSSARAISIALDITIPTVVKILKEHLHLFKKNSKWIPHELSESQIKDRVNVSIKLLSFLKNAPPWKREIIITCDESWFYLNYYHDEAWLPADKIIERPKRLISDQKVMFFTAFSTYGILLVEMLPNKIYEYQIKIKLTIR